MSRGDDVRSQRPVQRMAFAKNDKPTAVLQNLGWQEQQVSVEFIRQDSGKVVYQTTALLGRNETKYIAPQEPLTAGSYSVRVTPPSPAPPVVQNFSVYGY